MEAFEQFVAVALGGEGYVVSSNVKLAIKRQERKKENHAGGQNTDTSSEHGYEVDLVVTRADQLLLRDASRILVIVVARDDA